MEELEDGDPRRIGPYELLGKLGSGGMGRVFLGRSAAGALAAVKVVHPDLARDSEFRRRFRREVAATGAVSGPYVARIVRADTEAEHPWLATEYIAGPSLEARVEQQGPLPPHQVTELGVRLAGALAAIHDAGLVHRDVKPSNILLAEDGPKLIDFGIARDTADSRLTRTGVAVGTPLFMAPEQIQGDSEAGSAADVFALAGVLVYAATGGYAFGEGTAVQLLFRIVQDQPRLDGVPEELRPILAACLGKEPTRRPSARELTSALGAADSEALPPGFTALEAALDAAFDAMSLSSGSAQPSRDEVAAEGLDRGEVATVHLNRGPAPMESASPSGVGDHTSREPTDVTQGEQPPVVIAGHRPAPGKPKQNAYVFAGAGVLAAIVAVVLWLSGMSGVIAGSSDASANTGNADLAGVATSTAANGIAPTGPSSGATGTGGTTSAQAGKTGAPSAGGSGGTDRSAPTATQPGTRSTGSASTPATRPHTSSAGSPSAGGTSSAPGTKTSSPSAPANTAGAPACDTNSCSAFSHTNGVVRSVQADKCFTVDTRGSNMELPPLGPCTGAAAQWRIWRDGGKANVMFESLYYPGYCFGFNNPSLEPCSDNYIYMGWYTPSAVGQHWELKYYDGQDYCDTVDSTPFPGSQPCKSPASDSELWDFQ